MGTLWHQCFIQEKPKVGRPSIKSEELTDKICDLLASGHTLRSICSEDDFPAIQTINRWLREDKEFRSQYVRAREAQADYFADEIIDLSDEAKDGHSAQAAKVKIDARIWHASKTNKTKYGNDNKTEVNVSTAVVILDPQRQEQLQERRKVAEVEAVKLLDSGTKPPPSS